MTATEALSLYVDHGQTLFPLGDVGFIAPPRNVEEALLGRRPPVPDDASFGDRLANWLGYPNFKKMAAAGGGGGSQGNARYPVEPLENLLQTRFGDRRMSEALKPVSVVSCDIDRNLPVVFRGGGLDPGDLGDAPIWMAARATSAGPTYFQPLTYTTPAGKLIRCSDGGLVANDPALLAYTDAVATAGKVDVLLSLGTGLPPDSDTAEGDDTAALLDRRSWLGLAEPILRSLQGGPGELWRNQLVAVLGVNYVRIQTVLAHGAVHAMDNASPTNVSALRQTAVDLVSSEGPRLQDLADRLTHRQSSFDSRRRPRLVNQMQMAPGTAFPRGDRQSNDD